MSIEDILKMISGANVNMDEVLNAIKNLNYSDFSSEDLVKIKKMLIAFLDGSKPKLNIKCWSDFIILGIFFIVSFVAPFFKLIMMMYGVAILINVGIQIRKYFKIKSKYYSEEGIMQIARDALCSIDDILTFRKRKSEAIDLKETRVVQSDKTEAKVVNHDLNYLYRLLETINANLINVPSEFKVDIDLRFISALRKLDEIDGQEALNKVVAEFERIADMMVEVQQEEQNLVDGETLTGEARS